MAYTGVDLYNALKVRTNQGAAGAYLNIDRANVLLQSGRIKLLEADYGTMQQQKSIDEISPYVKTGKRYALFNTSVPLKPLQITNITAATNTFTITFDRAMSLQDGSLHFSGISGTGDVLSLNDTDRNIVVVDNYTITIDFGSPITMTYLGGGQITPNDNSLDNWIYDYYHLLAVALEYREDLSISILGIKCTNLYTEITVSWSNNLRSGEYLVFDGLDVLGTVSDVYIKKVAQNKVRLFNDAALTSPVIYGVAEYGSGGYIVRYNIRYADPLRSDQKIDVYHSTAYYPLYELGEIRIYIPTYIPYTNIPTTNIGHLAYIVDYISVMDEIDLTNNTTDILAYHNANFYDRLIEYVALKFDAMTGSSEDVQITEVIGGFKE